MLPINARNVIIRAYLKSHPSETPVGEKIRLRMDMIPSNVYRCQTLEILKHNAFNIWLKTVAYEGAIAVFEKSYTYH